MSLLQILYLGLALTLLYFLGHIIYNLFFHPLAKYPGPKLAAISELWYVKTFIGAAAPLPHCAAVVDKVPHEGDVVRTAPNELSISTPTAAKDIHGHPVKGRQTFVKSDFYQMKQGEALSISTEIDPQKHSEIRRRLAYAFSTKALRLQEDLVVKYIDMLVGQAEKHGSNPNGINVTDWYNWLTFDIIGDLTFGEPFGAVAQAKTNFWISIIFDASFAGALTHLFRRFPLLQLFIPWLLPNKDKLLKDRVEHRKLSREMALGRLQKVEARDDFFGHLISGKEVDEEQTLKFLESNASTLVTAGSETTATALSGMTYYLLHNPACLSRLQHEIRSAYSSSNAITGDSTQQNPYLKAVIEETLRIFPPAPVGMPRVSPGAEVDGHYVPAGTVVHSNTWVLMHSPKYWHRPEEFRPERWLAPGDKDYDVAFANDDHLAFKPFGQGPRGCIGVNLSYMEMRIILAKLEEGLLDAFSLEEAGLDGADDSSRLSMRT
ncbi:hypothetical protein BP5796_08360 [Coleophoma crateriformis]|uniref:Uncharacterized protein n=1 Tax=Coleophoma crateriformis TaxID=565419 RepID=A0A3D8R7E3_9HELO|nr:hypothetical protein BP5796_08360 [Coleophoma crateriformis]